MEGAMFKSLKWEDWLGIALGMWLLASPWVLGYSGQEAATMNALILGTILVLEETLELGVHENVEEWFDVVAGAWLLVSPVVLGFTSHAIATSNAIVVGALSILVALWAMLPFDERVRHWWHGRITGH